jgi:glucose/arabinose dehydrogenase
MTSFMKRLAFVLIVVGAAAAMAQPKFLPTALKGFKVSLVASAANARQMALSPQGPLYVGSMEAGQVHVIQNGRSKVLLKDLNYPSGILWHKGDLYIAEISRLSVIRGIDDVVAKGATPKLQALKSDFPADLNHGWKTLALGPDQKIYIPVGAPCNICPPDAPFASLHRLGLDGKGMETLARGIRNSVGMTFHPKTGELWFTEMGRDLMGDDMPADEINILKIGAHYGFPYLHAKAVKDPHYFSQLPPKLVTTPPVIEVPAHSAPIGILFTDGSPTFSKAFPGCFLLALHGSWNRSKKSGYEVTVGCPDKQNQVKSFKPFLRGFLKSPTVLGRPVDLQWDKDGALLVSDDHAGAVWRVEKTK